MRTLLNPGDPVRYVGPAVHPGQGAVGRFAWLPDFEIHTGARLRDTPGIVTPDGVGYACAADELEPLPESDRSL